MVGRRRTTRDDVNALTGARASTTQRHPLSAVRAFGHELSSGALPAADRIDHFAGKLIAYVRSLYPMRFYSGESWADLYASAALLRLADMADAVLAHMPARRDLDAVAALRSMYELVVTVCWVLAAPQERKELWEGEALAQELKLHNDLARFGETLLDAEQLEDGKNARGMPALADRAAQADAYWSTRVEGLHPGDHLLSFRGLYIAVYRLGSQPTHASIASLLPYIEQQARRFAVRQGEPDTSTVVYALVSPLLSIAVMVAATRFRAVDGDQVRKLNDAATAAGPL